MLCGDVQCGAMELDLPVCPTWLPLSQVALALVCAVARQGATALQNHYIRAARAWLAG
jgi:hypothetical protein